MNSRIEKVREYMKSEDMDSLIISDPVAIFYLTGKRFSPGERLLVLLINQDEEILYINRLFPTEEFGIKLEWYSDTDSPLELIAKKISGKVGIDKNFPARFLIPLMNLADCKYVEGSYIIDDIRAIKESDEIEKMKASSKANDRAMEQIRIKLSENLTEDEMGKYLKEVYTKLGASGFSFDPIVAYGKNGADPHHSNDDSKLEEGDSIVVDIGCVLDDYCSDMTRTFFYRSCDEESKKVYKIVLDANLAAIDMVKPGVKLSDVDKAARDVIESAGYGEYFTHRTGHFIGLEDHEVGDVSSANDDVCKVGNIFSIEPGIYLPGKIGVRIEDLVLVTEDGCIVLNEYPKDLMIID